MPAQTTQSAASERIASTMNGWGMLILNIALFLGGAYLSSLALIDGGPMRVVGALCALAGVIMVGGYFTLQPNQARVLILFGAYKGTVRSSGFHWANPVLLAQPRNQFAKGWRIKRGRRSAQSSRPAPRRRTGPAMAFDQIVAARSQLQQRCHQSER